MMPYGSLEQYCPGKDGKKYHVSDLPPNFTVEGDLILTDFPELVLPPNLTIKGTLNLQGSGIKSLPLDLTVGEEIILEGSLIQHLPDRLTATKISLLYTEVSSFGSDLFIQVLKTDSARAFTNKFKCDRLHLNNTKQLEMDLSNVDVQTVAINYGSSSKLSHLKNLKCSLLNMHSQNCTLRLSDSIIKKLRCSGSSTYLKLEGSVSCERVTLDFIRNRDAKPITLELIGSGVQELVMRTTAQELGGPGIKLLGNFAVQQLDAKNYHARLALPENCLVYQDVIVSEGIEIKIPETFCCLGSIKAV